MLFASSVRELWQTWLGYEIGHAKFSLRWWKLCVRVCARVHVCVCADHVQASHRRAQTSYTVWPNVQRFWALNWFRAPMRIDRINTRHVSSALLAYRVSPCWLYAEQVQSVHLQKLSSMLLQLPLKAQACNLQTRGNSLWDNTFTLLIRWILYC